MSVVEFIEFVNAMIPYEVRMIVYGGLVLYLYMCYEERKSAKQESKNKTND